MERSGQVVDPTAQRTLNAMAISVFRLARMRLRRLSSFSLRTGMLAVTVLGVWLGLHYRSVSQQRDLAEAVRRYGGDVLYDYEIDADGTSPNVQRDAPVAPWLLNRLGRDHFHHLAGVNLAMSQETWTAGGSPALILPRLRELPRLKMLVIGPQPVTDDDLRHVGELTELRFFCAEDGREVTDQGVQHLRNLRELRALALPMSNLTDQSLSVLSRLPKLRDLYVHGCQLTDEGLEHLGNMPQLRSLLILGGDAVFTDAGLAELGKLTRLESVTLNGMDATDEGLRHLGSLKSLRQLSLFDSNLDATWLSEQLPQCWIHVGFRQDGKSTWAVWEGGVLQ